MRLLLFLVLLAGAAALGVARLPPSWDPFAPLDLRQQPNLLTSWRIARAQRDPAQCLAALATAGPPVSPLPPVTGPEGCGIGTPVSLPDTAPARPVADCPLALAVAAWRMHGLSAAAEATLGTRVAQIEHLGTYACRDIRGREGRRSQHATGRALDISAFRLADGRRIPVTAWNGPEPGARFLRAARDSACRWFGAVLGPEYNAAHHDHFHVDTGGWGTCR